MSELCEACVQALSEALRAHADPARAAPMSAYMQSKFPFFGIDAPTRKRIQGPWIASLRGLDADALLDLAEALWRVPEREAQYVAVDALRRYAKRFDERHLERLRGLIASRSWWDTVDLLAAHVVGAVVLADPNLRETMRAWSRDPDLWVARTALLHQLQHRDRTDAALLFELSDQLAPHPDFFIRKAIGWALRQHARQDPEAVRAFVEAHRDALSGLSRREALKHLGA